MSVTPLKSLMEMFKLTLLVFNLFFDCFVFIVSLSLSPPLYTSTSSYAPPLSLSVRVAQKRLLRQRNVSLRHTVMLNVSNVIETTQLCLTHNSSKLTSTRSVAQEAHHSCHDASTNLSELLKRFKSVSVDEVRKGQRQAVSE